MVCKAIPSGGDEGLKVSRASDPSNRTFVRVKLVEIWISKSRVFMYTWA